MNVFSDMPIKLTCPYQGYLWCRREMDLSRCSGISDGGLHILAEYVRKARVMEQGQTASGEFVMNVRFLPCKIACDSDPAHRF